MSAREELKRTVLCGLADGGISYREADDAANKLIDDLLQEEAEKIRKLAVGESNTFLTYESGDSVPLGINSDIDFGSRFSANLNADGDLFVFTQGSMVICVEDSDSVVIKIQEKQPRKK
ncbi:hypothetical protein ACFWNC_14695 [Streptomyces sp. NPDC058369]|uniref:hypothetical protein n=1 Tax=Streptomyces sp. NPDC058369 TaxID=3346462 RepID=UPI003646FD76